MRTAARPNTSSRLSNSTSFLRWFSNLPGAALVALFVFVAIYPIAWIFFSSFKDASEFSHNPMWSLPSVLHVENYARAWNQGHMGTYFFNSVVTVVPSVMIVIALGVAAAFGIEIMRWRFASAIGLLFLAGIMVPIQIVLLPLFSMYYATHILDTRLALVLTYVAFGLPTTVFFLASFFKTFSREIIEAAIMDGASVYQVFFRIALPMVMNAVVTVALIQFFFMWNDLLVSLTFTSSPGLRTIQAGLLSFSGQYGQREWGPTFAAVALAVTPTVLIYLFLNQLVMKGLAAGAVKG